MKTILAVLAAALLTACSSGRAHHGPAAFDPTDTAWIQLLIPMNDQALTLLELAPARATRPEVRAWAKSAADTHRTELGELRRLLAQTGLPSTNVHEGHEMPGMVTETDLAAAPAKAFDSYLLGQLKDHLSQTATVSASAAANGSSPAARELAARIEKDHKALLAGLP